MDNNKKEDELATPRFGMLADIARELTGEVVFPTSFDTILRLRKELQNPSLSLTRVAQVVQLEPLVATRLMRLANSATYAALGDPVRELPSAINRLGLNMVRSTAMAVAVGAILHAKELVGFSKLAHGLWEHSIRSAAAARVLAKKFTRINADEALLAGLVHDLGAFYMLYRAVQYQELRERPDSLIHIIKDWHEGIGVTLLETLGLPPEIVEAAIDHDQPRPIPATLKSLVDIVYVANLLTGGTQEWLQLDCEANEADIALFQERYAELIPEIEAEAQEMRIALS